MGGCSSVPAGDLTEDDEQAIVESSIYPSDTIPPGNAAARPHKRRGSLLDGRDGKRTTSLDIGGGSGPTEACDVRPSERSGEESELPSSSGHPTETAWGNVMLDQSGGSQQNEQHFRSLEVDGVKHKIFLSHSGAQKDFAEQLCADLERGGFIAPFFDQRLHSLLKGKDFAPLIKEAAQHCHVAVIVLSEEFLCSKWPMIELGEFHAAQQAGNQRLSMLPLFYKLSVQDLGKTAIENRWKPKWKQLASSDTRIDVEKWSGAVRALRKANGLVFGQKGLSEVGYRKDIVQSIFKLSPPDLLYGSSRKMVGYSRLCKRVCERFVRGTNGGPLFLGLYGTSGAGKTTLSKALCDHYYGEYMGRVCHVDLGETPRMGRAWHVDLNELSRLRRVKRMLERLCGLDKEVLDRISDFDEGLRLMQMHMKREPVFLAFDNVTKNGISWDEAHEYLMVGFHPESRIMITSRSRSNIGGLVPDIELCVRMPRLSVREAGELFLRSAAPSKSIFGLTTEERRIVWLCIQQCLFSDQCLLDVGEDEVGCDRGEDEIRLLVEGDLRSERWKSYHPLALSALGDFFHRYFSNIDMLPWRDHLEKNKDPLWDLWKVPNGIEGIIGLQFHSLPPSEQLLFLDIAAFVEFLRADQFFAEFFGYDRYSGGCDGHLLRWLCGVHEETRQGMERRLQDLERSGMIRVSTTSHLLYPLCVLVAHDIYKRFAYWHMTNHGLNWLKNAYCVFRPPRSTLNRDFVASDLVRLRMFDLTRKSARLLTSKRIQELHSLEVLQLDNCPYLLELKLDGLESLWHLELKKLQNLVAVTLTKSPDTVENGGILESLQYVILEDLESLVRGPDVRLCTSLHGYFVCGCPSMTNLDEMECPHLELLWLGGLVANQLKRLPNVKALPVLGGFYIDSKCRVSLDNIEVSSGIVLRDVGKPYLRVVEELVMYLGTEWFDDHVSTETVLYILWMKRDPHFESLEWLDYTTTGVCR